MFPNSNTCKCDPLASRQEIARSNEVTILRCGCGYYWLKTQAGTRRTIGIEAVFCEMIESISKAVKVQETLGW